MAAVIGENLCRNRGLIDSHKGQRRKENKLGETPFQLSFSPAQ
jgi:hypothetical protein